MNPPTVGRSSADGAATRLAIGEVAALTGIKPGRIRHYEAVGLLPAPRTANGYRSFGSAEVLRLLHIDLLRSMGMGLAEISGVLAAAPGDLRASLARHRDTLEVERGRIERLLTAVDTALAEVASDGEVILGPLALVHRESLGVFGRLERPLSPAAAAAVSRLLHEGWGLPVPALFGQMLLPEPVSELLEGLVAAAGHDVLFGRLRALAARIMALGDDDAGRSAATLIGTAWVDEQLAEPPPAPVVAAVRRLGPAVARLPVMREGLVLWAESISPAAASALRAMEEQASRRGAGIVGAIVIPPAAG